MTSKTRNPVGGSQNTSRRKSSAIFVLAYLAIVTAVLPTRTAELMGCVTGCDCLSCGHEPGNCTTQGWYYIDGSCCWDWVSRTADNNKVKSVVGANRQRKKCNLQDCCVTVTLWGEAANCDLLFGNPTSEVCRNSCVIVSKK